MTDLSLPGLETLVAATSGDAALPIGLIDGPVVSSHPDFQSAQLRTLHSDSQVACQAPASPACQHGTFVAGILSSHRQSEAPGICPGCPVTVRPIFCEAPDLSQCPVVTPQDLAQALIDLVNSGVRVINMSVGLSTPVTQEHPELSQACDDAFQKGVLLVGASGNQGHVGRGMLFEHPWVIPVTACDQHGHMLETSNIGTTTGRQGLMAPGVDVLSTASQGGHTQMSGTSVAAPFVTGTIALLWSLNPGKSAGEIRRAILRPDMPRRSIVPPLLNGEASLQALQSG